jgi:hypothetical protein
VSVVEDEAFKTLQKRIHKHIGLLKKNLMVDPSGTDTVIVVSPQTWQFLWKKVHQDQNWFAFVQPMYAINNAPKKTLYESPHTVDILTIGGMKCIPDERLGASQIIFRTEQEVP